jgi:hypothetical protein
LTAGTGSVEGFKMESNINHLFWNGGIEKVKAFEYMYQFFMNPNSVQNGYCWKSGGIMSGGPENVTVGEFKSLFERIVKYGEECWEEPIKPNKMFSIFRAQDGAGFCLIDDSFFSPYWAAKELLQLIHEERDISPLILGMRLRSLFPLKGTTEDDSIIFGWEYDADSKFAISEGQILGTIEMPEKLDTGPQELCLYHETKSGGANNTFRTDLNVKKERVNELQVQPVSTCDKVIMLDTEIPPNHALWLVEQANKIVQNQGGETSFCATHGRGWSGWDIITEDEMIKIQQGKGYNITYLGD